MDKKTVINVTDSLFLNQVVGTLEACANALENYSDCEIQELAKKLHILAVARQKEADKLINKALKINPESDIWDMRDSQSCEIVFIRKFNC